MLYEMREKYCGDFTVAHYETDTEKFIELWDKGKPVASLNYKHGMWEIVVYVGEYYTEKHKSFSDAKKSFEQKIEFLKEMRK